MATIFSVLRASFAILLVLLPIATKGDAIPPVLSPLLDNICNDVQCGKGKCEADMGKPFGFVCECESGWKRTRDSDEDNLQFLPCIIPNCSLDYSCMPAAPPTPPIPNNFSLFDPCYWMYCGEGTCTRNSTYKHTCQCNPGRSNLLNISAFPCYNDCALGSDCSRLGIRIANTTSTPGSSNEGSPATLILPAGKLTWTGILLMSTLPLMWK
ncbi:hypothetical protein M9H77_07669 [Catharanthus roseus]|uniref:Uncharacterized protein n=1 Tax=Catharanthus roseus TaxID=4058 RepID=A0ACC0BVS7_CATRO|nr:hypothetical protein M9H77_07669 [Catharanthus roseus]